MELTHADADWLGTRMDFELDAAGDTTTVRFRHVNWPEVTDHYRISCFCGAMYLRDPAAPPGIRRDRSL